MPHFPLEFSKRGIHKTTDVPVRIDHYTRDWLEPEQSKYRQNFISDWIAWDFWLTTSAVVICAKEIEPVE
jgi:hypothetical protein